MFINNDNLRSAFSWMNALGAAAAALPKPEVNISESAEMPPIDEERLEVYRQHNIFDGDPKMIERIVHNGEAEWKSSKDQFVKKNEELPRNLFVKRNPDVEGGLEVFIHCEDRKIGEGSYSAYVEFLESKSLITYAGTIVKYEDKLTRNGVVEKTADEIYGQACRLRRVYDVVNGGPNIVSLRASFNYKIARDPVFSTPCMALIFDHCEVGNLENYLEGESSLSDREIRQILLDVSQGLEYLHGKKFVHHDVKEANILLTRDENGGLRGKVGDLGLALEKGKFEGKGTPSYFPPEFWIAYPGPSKDSLDDSDVWALGNVMLSLLGKEPFVSDKELCEIEEKHKDCLDLLPRMMDLKLLISDKKYPTFEEDEELTIYKISRQIIQFDRTVRLNMTEVRERLEDVSFRA